MSDQPPFHTNTAPLPELQRQGLASTGRAAASAPARSPLRLVLLALLAGCVPLGAALHVEPAREVALPGGVTMPALVLGTYQLGPGLRQCVSVLEEALAAGYRHFDTAPSYELAERCVGITLKRAFEAGTLRRDEVFVTTKVPGSIAASGVAASASLSLDSMGLDYVDLLLVHWPASTEYEQQAVWAAMERVQEIGMARAVGVSNYDVDQLAATLKKVSRVAPAVNQVELSPATPQVGLREFCRDHGIVLQGYTPFGEPSLLGDAAVQSLVSQDGHGRTAAQLLLWWNRVHAGAVTVMKASSRNRLLENAEGLLGEAPLVGPAPTAVIMQALDVLGSSSTSGESEL